MSYIPQVTVKSHAVMRFCIRNQGTRIWFEHEIDLMDKCGNVFDALSDKITYRCNMFTFMVLKKLEKETGSWLKENNASKHRAYIKDVHDRAHKLKDKIGQKHHLFDKPVDECEKQIPVICVSVINGSVHIQSDDEYVVVGNRCPIDVECLPKKITKIFEDFYKFEVCVKFVCEIWNALQHVENVFSRDKRLIAIKTCFEQRMAPRVGLKEWVERVRYETDSNGRSNPDYRPGMDDLADRYLRTLGYSIQAYVTKKFHEGSGVKVLGVENRPWHPDKNPNTKKDYDVDIWLGCDGKKVPIQVGVWEGELVRKVLDSDVCPGEVIPSNEAVSGGGVNMVYWKKSDFDALCKKLGQVPLGGVVLWVSPKAPLPGSNPRPVKEWYGEPMNKKCVIVWMCEDKAVIHHNNTGFDLPLAKKLCLALGDDNPKVCTGSEESLNDK